MNSESELSNCTICCQNFENFLYAPEDTNISTAIASVISQTICKLFRIQDFGSISTSCCPNCSSLILNIYKILQNLDEAKLQLEEIIIKNTPGVAGDFILDQSSTEIARNEIIKRIKPCRVLYPVGVNIKEDNEVVLNEVLQEGVCNEDFGFNLFDEDNFFETEESQEDHIGQVKNLKFQFNLKTLVLRLTKLPQSLVNHFEQKDPDTDLKFIQDEIDRHLKKDHENQIKSKSVISSIVINRFPCTKCAQSFNLYEVLEEHNMLMHKIKPQNNQNKTQVHKCPKELCDREFSKWKQLYNHLRAHEKFKDKFQCKICQSLFDFSRILQRHLKSVHNYYEVYQCPEDQCDGKTFSTKKQLRSHSRHHRKCKEKFPCTFCPSTFDFEKNLHRHMKTVHNYNIDDKPDPKVICETCGIILSRASYKAHINHKHSESESQKKQCSICKLWLKNDFYLTRHKIKHKWTKSLKFSCKTCGRCFDKKRNLRGHEIYTHSTVKNYICPEPHCKRAFTNMFTLRNHAKIHVVVVGRPFVCSFEGCKKAYRQKSALNIHFEVCHKYKSPDEFPYECLICKEKFPRQSLLNNHRQLKTHIFLTEEEKQMKEQETQEIIS